jgi:hypothetical protein
MNHIGFPISDSSGGPNKILGFLRVPWAAKNPPASAAKARWAIAIPLSVPLILSPWGCEKNAILILSLRRIPRLGPLCLTRNPSTGWYHSAERTLSVTGTPTLAQQLHGDGRRGGWFSRGHVYGVLNVLVATQVIAARVHRHRAGGAVRALAAFRGGGQSTVGFAVALEKGGRR